MDLRDRADAAPSGRRKVRTADCRNCLLMKSLVAAGMSSSSVQAICDRMWLNRIRRRQLIMMEGNQATQIHTLRSGRVKLFRMSLRGKEHISGVLKSGDMFGLDALFRETYTLAAEALSDSEVCSAPASEIRGLMAEVPAFAFDVARYLHYQLNSARERLAVIGTASARTRVAGFLIRNVDGHPGNRPVASELRRDLTLEEIGGVLGLSGETVSRALGTLKTDRIIEVTPDLIRVLDFDALERAARV